MWQTVPDSKVAITDFWRLCDHLSLGICVLKNDRIQYANPAMSELLGAAPGALVGGSLLEYVDPATRSDAELLLRQARESAAPVRDAQVRLLGGSGKVVPVAVDVSRIMFADEESDVVLTVSGRAPSEAESDMHEAFQFERLLADLSASFVNLPSEKIDSQIDDSLKKLVEFLGNDRSTLVEFEDDADRVLVTHSYSVPDCETFPLGPFPRERLPWFIGQFQSGETVFVRTIPGDLPAEAGLELQYCLKHGIKSNVTVPLKVGGNVLGGLTFAFITRSCDWRKGIVSRLQLIGEVFANALLRRRSDEALQAALAEN